MKKQITFLFMLIATTIGAMAQDVTATWSLSDKGNLGNVVVSGESSYTSLLTPGFAQGAYLAASGTMTSSTADNGFVAVAYDPAFTQFQPSAQVSTKTTGHSISVGLTPQNGHKFKPTKISFDAAKCGTDAGGIEVYYKIANGAEVSIGSVSPLRNKIMSGNSTGYSHCEFYINDVIADSKTFTLELYITNIATTKSMAVRNVTIEGEVDNTTIYTASSFLTALTFNGKTGSSAASQLDLFSAIKDLKNGENVRYTTKLYAEPTDFVATAIDGYTATVDYTDHKATVTVKQDEKEKFTCSATFTVSTAEPKGDATPLKRGLIAIYTTSNKVDGTTAAGNLVTWRARKTDDRNLKFKLWRGTNATTQAAAVNSGNYIVGKNNFLDASGAAGNYYKLEVYDGTGSLIETEVSEAAWDGQVKYINLEGGAPTDPTSAKATYTPNDASFCDMDGDGEYEIVLKWSPSNEKDAASSGTTSPAFYGCYKLNGKRLWILHTGPNMFNSAHTTPFIAWDLDGDGFGEFMVKTAPGAIDGEGNYVVMAGDDPTASLKNSNGKQVSGPEYLTVFDGRNGSELKTIAYHTNYAAGASYWGDSKQNRSERYLAALAYLDGPDSNPSAIFARGYYAGAFIGAADWDGTNLSWRWVHKAYSANNGEVVYADGTTKKLTTTVHGEGAHWISVADVNGDGKQEITYGSGALKPDGTTLYRTGLGHGDALHISDFDPNRPGLECFMAHEEGPGYGIDYRDATTGDILLRKTASSDTGRGFMANFDPERDDALWQASAWSGLYDGNGNTVVETVSHGGGAGVQDRVYWTGTLADDFWGKSVLETWNGSSFGRLIGCVNGGNYTYGHTNNDSKDNACCIGDILGDWREEIMCWTEDGSGGYQLTINETNYQTDYTVPHLMDDLGYRSQVVNENCAYNQPPHLDYNLRTSKKVTRQCFEVEPSATVNASLGKYWDCFYTTYPVIVPSGVTAWQVTARATKVDTVRMVKLAENVVVGANTFVIYNSSNPTATFTPTTQTASVKTAAVRAGSYCDSIMAEHTTKLGFYEFREGNRGLGFYLADGKTIPGGTGFLRITGTVALPVADSYVLGAFTNPETSIVGDVNNDSAVNISDVNAVITVMCGGEANAKADVNGDGVVNISDVNAVISIMCGN